jgi:hypothetical protein
VEFVYYWQHRISHECRWFWATHSVHHSPNHMVLLGALRLGWTGAITGQFLFFVPLVLMGYSAIDVLIVLGINLIYQFWLHTELIGKLGPLEWVFNTPSHHRAHHASNPEYIDRNYGGVLIIFDRLFGTFAEEREDVPLKYGLVKPIYSYNPFRIALNEWLVIAKELQQSRSLSQLFTILFSAPAADASTSQLPQRSSNMKTSMTIALSACLLAGATYAQNMQRKPTQAQVQQFKMLLSDEMPKRFAAADVNKDNQLTKQEAQSGMPRVYQNFDAIDAQKKGYITQQDITVFAEQKIAQAKTKKPAK